MQNNHEEKNVIADFSCQLGMILFDHFEQDIFVSGFFDDEKIVLVSYSGMIKKEITTTVPKGIVPKLTNNGTSLKIGNRTYQVD